MFVTVPLEIRNQFMADLIFHHDFYLLLCVYGGDRKYDAKCLGQLGWHSNDWTSVSSPYAPPNASWRSVCLCPIIESRTVSRVQATIYQVHLWFSRGHFSLKIQLKKLVLT